MRLHLTKSRKRLYNDSTRNTLQYCFDTLKNFKKVLTRKNRRGNIMATKRNALRCESCKKYFQKLQKSIDSMEYICYDNHNKGNTKQKRR